MADFDAQLQAEVLRRKGQIAHHEREAANLRSQCSELQDALSNAERTRFIRSRTIQERWHLRALLRALRAEDGNTKLTHRTIRSMRNSRQWDSLLTTQKSEIERLVVESAVEASPFAPQSAIYVLLRGNDIVYVGKSTILLNRLTTHFQERIKSFDRIFVLPVPSKHLDRVERIMIATLRPAMNRTFMRDALSDIHGLGTRMNRAFTFWPPAPA